MEENIKLLIVDYCYKKTKHLHLHNNESSRARSPAEQNPTKPVRVRLIIATIVARETWSSVGVGVPRLRGMRTAYRSLTHDDSKLLT